MKNNILLGLVAALLFSVEATASDLAKEQRWREQVADSIMDGEEVDVMVDGRGVFGIYTEAAEDSTKGMIIAHGIGVHPNWDQVILPLRVEMAERGWHTLSIQMPILKNEAEARDYFKIYPEAGPRLEAAEKFLQDRGIKNWVYVGHSAGSQMMALYLSKRSPSQAIGFVAVGMNTEQDDPSVNAANSLKKIKLPVLDLYGSEDLEFVLNSAEKKRLAASHNKAYTQKMVKGANHFFDGKNDELIEIVEDWSSKL